MKAGQLITEPGKCMTEIYSEPQDSASITNKPTGGSPISTESEPEQVATTTEPMATSTEPEVESDNDQSSAPDLPAGEDGGGEGEEPAPAPETCENPITYYLDADGDGYGNPEASTSTCNQPASYVIDNTDCDDNKILVYPGAQEVCNGLDNSCNGEVDDGCDCGITQCSISLNLFGQCDNSCMGELGCGICEPSCGCTQGFSDCDNDLSNGCETAGECVAEEPQLEPQLELVDSEDE